MKRRFCYIASSLLSTGFLLFSMSVFAEEENVKYTPFSVQTGGTGATNVEKAKKNLEIPDVVQTTGQSETSVMSQKAVSDAIASGSGGNIIVTQETGESTTYVMSQKAVTDALDDSLQNKITQSVGQSTTEVMSQKAVTDAINSVPATVVVQNIGESETEVMSQKAVTDAIEAVPKTKIVHTTGQSTTEVMSQKAVTDAILTSETIFNMIYPIGSIYMSVNSVDPGLLFGGTWVQWCQGRVPVGIDINDGDFNSSEKTGGHKKMQAHTHRVSIDYTGNYSHNHSSRTNYLCEGVGGNRDGNYSSTDTLSNSGEGDSQNLQPYITCYMWKRIA